MITTIFVIGAGYVGLSNAVLLAQPKLANQVTLVDIDAQKIAQLQQQESPIDDALIAQFLATQSLNLTAQLVSEADFSTADLVIIATPTNYDVATGKFDTSSVEASIQTVRAHNAQVPIVIKSTVPIGFTRDMQAKFDTRILFMPEFLREGKALYDNLHPSRIIVGCDINHVPALQDVCHQLITQYQTASEQTDTLSQTSRQTPSQIMPPTEAEAVKLFANSYLATRIAFFNELDSFAESMGLDSESIITGVSLDPRIGMHYNNPSFGYGGYCLPKDTQQLKANYAGIPANVIHAVVDANNTRKRFVARQIIAKQPNTVGVYRLSMKKDADNFRDSAILDIIELLKQHAIDVQIYEPSLSSPQFMDCPVVNDLASFLQTSDVIVANRLHPELAHVEAKVYSRDVFGDSWSLLVNNC